MRFNDIIRAAMEKSGTIQQALGDKLGIRQNAVSNIVNRSNIALNTFVTIMNILGYEIVVRPKDGEEEMSLTNE